MIILATVKATHFGKRGDVVFSTAVSNLPANESLFYTLQKGVDTSYQLGTDELFYLNTSKLILFFLPITLSLLPNHYCRRLLGDLIHLVDFPPFCTSITVLCLSGCFSTHSFFSEKGLKANFDSMASKFFSLKNRTYFRRGANVSTLGETQTNGVAKSQYDLISIDRTINVVKPQLSIFICSIYWS